MPLCPSSCFRLGLSFGVPWVNHNAHHINLCCATMIQKANDGRSSSATAIPPSIIIGGGRIGLALRDLGSGGDVVVKRGEKVPSEPSNGPIYVSERDIAVIPLSRILWCTIIIMVVNDVVNETQLHVDVSVRVLQSFFVYYSFNCHGRWKSSHFF